jgi:prevent-host-death family protein
LVETDHRRVQNVKIEISVTRANAQLTELIRRAEAGDEIILTRHGNPMVRLAPVAARPSPAERRQIIAEVQKLVREPNLPAGPSAARSQDLLYDEDGLPG